MCSWERLIQILLLYIDNTLYTIPAASSLYIIVRNIEYLNVSECTTGNILHTVRDSVETPPSSSGKKIHKIHRKKFSRKNHGRGVRCGEGVPSEAC